MKTAAFVIVAVALVAGCASKKVMSSGEAKAQLQEEWTNRIGTAQKSDLVQTFGNAEWCRENSGGEECRFYKKVATNWVGEDKRDKKSYLAFDEVVATFDSEGTLKTVKANAQR